MSDTLAGTTLTPWHFLPPAEDTETGSYTTTTSSGYNVNGTGYPGDTGDSFTGPASGRGIILFRAQMDNSSATGRTVISPAVRTGSTVGSGTDVLTADDARNIYNQGTDDRAYGAFVYVSGLTPGDLYNWRLEHKVTAATTGTISNCQGIWIPTF